MGRIVATVAQGGADAYAEADMQTALQGQTKTAYLVKEISYEFLGNNILGTVNNAQSLELCISRRSKAAMPNITDVDVLKKWKFLRNLATAVGMNDVGFASGIWKPETDILIVEDPIYVQLDSNATGLTLSAVIAIEYEIVSISEVDRLTLLTQSLQ